MILKGYEEATGWKQGGAGGHGKVCNYYFLLPLYLILLVDYGETKLTYDSSTISLLISASQKHLRKDSHGLISVVHLMRGVCQIANPKPQTQSVSQCHGRLIGVWERGREGGESEGKRREREGGERERRDRERESTRGGPNPKKIWMAINGLWHILSPVIGPLFGQLFELISGPP